MKTAIILGRGIEGCGVTKNVAEFQRLYGDNIRVFATADKIWPRHNSMEFEYELFKASSWSEKKKSRKFGELLSCTDVLTKINDCGRCIIFSVPSKSHPKECQDNFVKLVQNITVRKSVVQVDHNIQSINRNARLKDILSSVDIIMTHSTLNPFAMWCWKQGINVTVTDMGVGYNFEQNKFQYWRPIEEQHNKTIRWVGRSAGWKGPQLMIDFHNEHLKNKEFITILEGLEPSHGFRSIIYRDEDDASTRRDIVNKFRPEKEYNETSDFEYGNEESNKGAYCYPAYVLDEMMQRMACSTFGSDLYHLKPTQYGNNIEYCHADCIGAGTVPIYHKHFGQHIIHRKQGKHVIECNDTGTLFLDENNGLQIAETMLKLSNDAKMRDEYRNMAYEFWKQHADAKTVYDEIIEKTTNGVKNATTKNSRYSKNIFFEIEE